MDFVATIKAWVEANPENPVVDIVAWVATIIEFIASL